MSRLARPSPKHAFFAALAVAALLPLSPLRAAEEQAAPDLTELSLSDLMQVEVTSASRKGEELFGATAAITVLTQDDIRRSGATSIPQVLGLVPGLQVARINQHQWAISARGFNWPWANKLLVLVDGRSVYTPLFAGVHWDARGVALDDIERIEVIRGPGATMWGANAVNGVINIITKPSGETLGGRLEAVTGTEDHVGTLRWGARVGPRTTFRVDASHRDEDAATAPGGGADFDAWHAARASFRLDHETKAGALMLSGAAHDGAKGQVHERPVLTAPYVERVAFTEGISGGHLLGRWTRRLEKGGEITLQGSAERSLRSPTGMREERSTGDLDFQHRLGIRGRNELLWGFGARVSRDDITSRPGAALDPSSRTDRLVSAFVQDDIRLAGGRGRLTLGTKIETHRYAGTNVQPSVRFLWRTSERQAFWTSLSRAVRTPSRAEQDIRYDYQAFPNPDGSVTMVRVVGSRDMRSEELTALEAGYRVRPTDQLTLDVAAYWNRYDHLRTAEAGTPALEMDPFPHAVLPLVILNEMSGNVRGAEATLSWQPTQRWRLSGSWTWLDMALDVDRKSTDQGADLIEGESPRHHAELRSSLDLPRGFDLEARVQWTSALPHLDVRPHLGCDLGFGWRPSSRFELRVTGRDLLEPHHREFGEAFAVVPTRVDRSVDVKATWRF